MTTLHQDRPLPANLIDPATEPYFAAARNGVLKLRQCTSCMKPHWYPRPLCPFCLADTEWIDAIGTGTIYSVSVTRKAGPIPYAIAYVALDEGVTMLTNIVDCDLDTLRIGQRVKVCFKPTDGDGVLPMFTPAERPDAMTLQTLPTLRFDVADGIGWIRLTRPDKRNPFDTELREDLMQVLEQVRADAGIRVLVLAGSPGAFCAGGNLHFLKAQLDAGPAYWQQRLQSGLRLINDLLRLTRPLIAVVDGPAYGAGFSLALTADIVLVSPQARFSMSYLKLGVVPDLGPTYLLPRIVGLQRAKEIIFSCREVGADEAQRLGIAMEVCASTTIEARAQEIAQSLTLASPTAIGLTKAALNASLDCDQQTMFAIEASSQGAAFAAPEPRAAIEAMLAKQAPAYKGFSPANKA